MKADTLSVTADVNKHSLLLSDFKQNFSLSDNFRVRSPRSTWWKCFQRFSGNIL